jgi:uncharacterized surface protein with fasciclin (FAS1) repeats
LSWDDPGSEQNIVEVISESEEHTILADAIETANLTTLLTGYSEGAFTLFAPTDEAFQDNLSRERINELRNASDPEVKEEVLDLVLYHLTSYRLTSDQVRELDFADAAQGDSLEFSPSSGDVSINGKANLSRTDIDAKNGVIHSIDSVLMPPSLE